MTRMFAYTTLALTLILGTRGASATHYMFQPNWGVWSEAGNWDPPDGPPDADDEATIPGGKSAEERGRQRRWPSVLTAGGSWPDLSGLRRAAVPHGQGLATGKNDVVRRRGAAQRERRSVRCG